ncbi:hypothetical protein [Clostridium polynesiense]|uniref:hypothetical protein n=1 Tax=Clostridium polynesiense TaxID=1325933 RepID=UPI00058C4175|nr:hypothetical protein [Clostridium polynesiense]
MTIFEEFKLSFKPQRYHKFREESLGRTLIYQLIITVLALAVLFFNQLTKQFLTGSANQFLNLFRGSTIYNVAGTVIYMWLGIIISALLLSSVFYGINHIKHIKTYKFKEIYNYTAHSLTIAALLSPFFGLFSALVSISVYVYAVRMERGAVKG